MLNSYATEENSIVIGNKSAFFTDSCNNRLVETRSYHVIAHAYSSYILFNNQWPEATNCFSIITFMIIRENKITDQFPSPKHQQIWLPFWKTASLQCYNHRAVIIAG